MFWTRSLHGDSSLVHGRKPGFCGIPALELRIGMRVKEPSGDEIIEWIWDENAIINRNGNEYQVWWKYLNWEFEFEGIKSLS